MKVRPTARLAWGISYDPVCKHLSFFPFPFFGLCIEFLEVHRQPNFDTLKCEIDKLARSFHKLAADSEELAAISTAMDLYFGKEGKYGIEIEGASTSGKVFDAFQKLLRLSEKREQRTVPSSPVHRTG